jgi:flagellar motor switch protein FliG
MTQISPSNAPRGFSGVERAAVLMMLVGDEEAAAILKKLDPDEVRRLGKAMFAVADVAEPQVAAVLDDFVARARSCSAIGFDPRPQIETMMTKALGPERADTVLSRITPREEACAIEMLDWLEPEDMAALLRDEHPQVAAVLLANVDPAVAAQVIEHLPEPMQPDVLHRIATLGPISPDALAMLRDLLARRPGLGAPGLPLGGTREAAAIMNKARAGVEQRVMPRIAKIDRETARRIEEEMFVFEHLLDLDPKSLGTLLRAVDSDVLVLALRGADEDARAIFLSAMSQRAADTVRDEIDARGQVRLSDVLDAQRQMLATARRLAKEGAIRLGNQSDDYV